MKKVVNKSLLAIAVTSLLAAPIAHATNGYFMHGYSTKEKGLAGAGVAFSQDALASATNPAGIAFVGTRLDLGVELFSPSPRRYTVTGAPGTGTMFPLADESVKSQKDFFLIPHFGYSRVLDSKSSVGVAVYGNGGMNTQYKPTAANGNQGVFGGGRAGVNLEQMFFNFSYAYKLKPNQAIGVSLLFVGERFSAEGLGQFGAMGFSTDPNNLTGKGHSVAYGGGIKIGYQGEVAPGLRVGVSYQSKMSMGKFDKYKGLFANKGGFDIPSTYTLGIAYDVANHGTIVADYQRIMYSDVASISNPMSNLLKNCNSNTTSGCLGGPAGGGFGWQDIGVVKVGYQWNAMDTDWRVGYSHSDEPIPSSEVMFNILAPGVITDHLTFGFTKNIASNQEFNFAMMYAPNHSVTGPNPTDPTGSQKIKIEMSQIDVQAGWAWKF